MTIFDENQMTPLLKAVHDSSWLSFYAEFPRKGREPGIPLSIVPSKDTWQKAVPAFVKKSLSELFVFVP